MNDQIMTTTMAFSTGVLTSTLIPFEIVNDETKVKHLGPVPGGGAIVWDTAQAIHMELQDAWGNAFALQPAAAVLVNTFALAGKRGRPLEGTLSVNPKNYPLKLTAPDMLAIQAAFWACGRLYISVRTTTSANGRPLYVNLLGN